MRAIAVLAVVANHLNLPWLRGGFAGVDVFFVISGYLIGMHLMEDIAAGQFSFLRFYARRARRLLPALVVVLAAVWGFGWMILSPSELAALGKHIAAATIFSNNILLWMESGYFDTASAGKPLLHLWSLGVEEQFYLLVPLLLWLGARRRSASIAWVARAGVVSLLLNELTATPSFYLLDTRFWELGVGVAVGYLTLHASQIGRGTLVLTRGSYGEAIAWIVTLMFATALLLASREHQWDADTRAQTCGIALTLALALLAAQLLGAYRQPELWRRLAAWLQARWPVARNYLAIAGVVLLGLTLALAIPAGWPGGQALFPVLGSAFLIIAGPRAVTSELLGSRPLAFVGGISYPLYLWHWPLLVYGRMLGATGHVGELLVVVLAFALAWCTKELIEDPVRFGRLFGTRVPRPRLGIIAVGLLLVGAIGFSSVVAGGYRSRFPSNLAAIADWVAPGGDEAWRAEQCYFYPRETIAFATLCTPRRRTGVPRVLLWGDSHAAQLYPGLVELRKHSDFDVIQWTSAGCPPTRVAWPDEQSSCEARRAWILRQMRAETPDTVLMAARWPLYLAGGVPSGSIVAAVADDIQWLQSLGVRHVVVFGPGPEWNVSLPLDLFRYMSLRRTPHIPERLGAVPAEARELDRALSAAATDRGAQYVSVLDWFCNSSGCRTLGNESERRPDLLFRDHDHLTPSGARELVSAASAKILASSPHS